MTSKLNLTAAKIRRFFLVTALVICPFIALQSGKAQDTVTATLLSGGNNFISIAQGGSFSFTLAVTTNFNSLGYTVFLATNAAGNGQFQIDGRMNLNGVFTDPTTPDGTALGNPNGILGNMQPGNIFANFRDLGYTGDGFSFVGPGTFSLATYTITNIGMMAPGTYQIFLDPRSIMTNPAFQDVAMGGNPIFTITVIPEPTTIGLAILGGGALLVVARRKLRARA